MVTRHPLPELRLREGRPDDTFEEHQHDLPVEPRVLLRPVEVVEVGVHLGGPGEEDREVTVGQAEVVLEGLRRRDVPIGELLADVPRARVEHEPHGPVGIEGDLDEVVAATERPALSDRPAAPVGDLRRPELPEAREMPVDRRAEGGISGDVGVLLVRCEPHGDGGLDRHPQRREVVGQIGGGE